MASSTLLDEIADQFLICQICSEVYKRPKSLRCLHTFCEECLEIQYAIEEQNRSHRFLVSRALSCPLCQTKTELPSGGVRRLPDNSIVTQLGDVIRRSKRVRSAQLCSICDVTNSQGSGISTRMATVKCLDCAKLLCQKCVELHRRIKVTKGHSLYDLEADRDVDCKIHRDEPVRFYCEPCQTCVCVLCTFQDHVGHAILSFKDAVDMFRSPTAAMLDTCREMNERMRRRFNAVQRCDTDFNEAETAIRGAVIDSIARLRRHERELTAKLRSVYGEPALEYVAGHRSTLAEMSRKLDSLCCLTDVLLAEGKTVEFLLMQSEIREKLEGALAEAEPMLGVQMPEGLNKTVKFVTSRRGIIERDLGRVVFASDPPENHLSLRRVDSSSSSGYTDISSDSVEDGASFCEQDEAGQCSFAGSTRCDAGEFQEVGNSRGDLPLEEEKLTETKSTNTSSVMTVDRSTLTIVKNHCDRATTTDWLIVTRDQETFTMPPLMHHFSQLTDRPRMGSKSVQCAPDQVNKLTMTRSPIRLERETNTPVVAMFDCEVTARIIGCDQATSTGNELHWTGNEEARSSSIPTGDVPSRGGLQNTSTGSSESEEFDRDVSGMEDRDVPGTDDRDVPGTDDRDVPGTEDRTDSSNSDMFMNELDHRSIEMATQTDFDSSILNSSQNVIYGTQEMTSELNENEADFQVLTSEYEIEVGTQVSENEMFSQTAMPGIEVDADVTSQNEDEAGVQEMTSHIEVEDEYQDVTSENEVEDDMVVVTSEDGDIQRDACSDESVSDKEDCPDDVDANDLDFPHMSEGCEYSTDNIEVTPPIGDDVLSRLMSVLPEVMKIIKHTGSSMADDIPTQLNDFCSTLDKIVSEWKCRNGNKLEKRRNVETRSGGNRMSNSSELPELISETTPDIENTEALQHDADAGLNEIGLSVAAVATSRGGAGQDRASSPFVTQTSEHSTSTHLCVNSQSTNTPLLYRVDIGVETKRVSTCDSTTTMPQVRHQEKETSTPYIHILHKNTSTDNQSTADKQTSTGSDVTAAYLGAAVKHQAVFVSRGTCTSSRGPSFDFGASFSTEDRGSSPVRFSCVDKAISVRKGEVLEPVDTFQAVGKKSTSTKKCRPFVSKSKLECIREGLDELEENEEDEQTCREISNLTNNLFSNNNSHRPIQAPKNLLRNFSQRNKLVDLPLSPRPLKPLANNNSFNFDSARLFRKSNFVDIRQTQLLECDMNTDEDDA